jgi:phi LC3 family holin
MNKINWKVRFKNPIFIIQIVVAVILPILGYFGLTVQDVITWPLLGETLLKAILNPYVLVLVGVSVFNAINDPTTEGLNDSNKAMTYEEPKKTSEW